MKTPVVTRFSRIFVLLFLGLFAGGVYLTLLSTRMPAPAVLGASVVSHSMLPYTGLDGAGTITFFILLLAGTGIAAYYLTRNPRRILARRRQSFLAGTG